MSKNFRADFLPTAIGSFPHTDPIEACNCILKYLPQIPVWPQLPKLGPMENMYAQFASKFPGTEVIDGVVYYDPDVTLGEGLERLYVDYLSGETDYYKLEEAQAIGFKQMIKILSQGKHKISLFKGQITGPISLGLQMVDKNRKSAIYDEVVADALNKYLSLLAAAQEKEMSEVKPETVIFVDEPYLQAIGSAFIQLSREQVINSLNEVFSGIKGLKGIHCCANTDWGMILATKVYVLSFDAYSYGDSLSLYAEEVRDFLDRGGIIAWGIVPNTPDKLINENEDSLMEKLCGSINLLVKKGLSKDLIVRSSLITPTCGLGSGTIENAENVLSKLATLSDLLRSNFGLI